MGGRVVQISRNFILIWPTFLCQSAFKYAYNIVYQTCIVILGMPFILINKFIWPDDVIHRHFAFLWRYPAQFWATKNVISWIIPFPIAMLEIVPSLVSVTRPCLVGMVQRKYIQCKFSIPFQILRFLYILLLLRYSW